MVHGRDHNIKPLCPSTHKENLVGQGIVNFIVLEWFGLGKRMYGYNKDRRVVYEEGWGTPLKKKTRCL